MPVSSLWSPLNSEPWCTVFCRLFDMAPHLGTFLVLIKVSERAKKMCLPWPRRWAGPCYRMPRYFVHETIRLFLVLFFFFQIWFQFWFSISLVLTIGYGISEHRVKRNIIPSSMLIIGVTFYTVCWCGLFGRKQDGSHAAAQRQKPTDRAKNQDDENNENSPTAVLNNNNSLNLSAFNNNNKGDEGQNNIPKMFYGQTAPNYGTIPDYEDDLSGDETAPNDFPRCITSMPNLLVSPGSIGTPTPAQIGTPTPAHIGLPTQAPTTSRAMEDQFIDVE